MELNTRRRLACTVFIVIDVVQKYSACIVPVFSNSFKCYFRNRKGSCLDNLLTAEFPKQLGYPLLLRVL